MSAPMTRRVVTPSKIQPEGSRWNRRFGSGGNNVALGSADIHTSPRSRRTSSHVIPPMRNSATSASSASDPDDAPDDQAVAVVSPKPLPPVPGGGVEPGAPDWPWCVCNSLTEFLALDTLVLRF
ncbi:MAG TPA: hypothetical protein VED63_11345 [Acidimicrobiales bacterium]|nr:hypothetical protein [Acidimicrobiales bacterium]